MWITSGCGADGVDLTHQSNGARWATNLLTCVESGPFSARYKLFFMNTLDRLFRISSSFGRPIPKPGIRRAASRGEEPEGNKFFQGGIVFYA